MTTNDYSDLIARTERTLQNHVGNMIGPGIRFDGFGKAYLAETPALDHSTPVVFPLHVNPLALDGDDSHEAFEDADGDRITEEWLIRRGLMDGQIFFSY